MTVYVYYWTKPTKIKKEISWTKIQQILREAENDKDLMEWRVDSEKFLENRKN